MNTELTPLNKKFYAPIKTEFIDRGGIDEANFKIEASFAMQILEKNKFLQTANRESILKAVLNVAQIGLTLNPVRKYAYLIPRYNRALGFLECVLDPSYVGLIKLLTDSGSVKSIQCQLIFEGDEIEIDLASDRKIIKHIPYIITGKDRGKIRAVYSLAILHDNSFHCELMSWADVVEIRERSEAWKAYQDKDNKLKTCVWLTDEGEMTRKTVLKRHFKHLPKTDKTERFEKAVELSHVVNGSTEPSSYEQIGFIEALIITSILSEDEKSKISSEIVLLEYKHQATKVIEYLLENQPTVGIESFPANETEIASLTHKKAMEDE